RPTGSGWRRDQGDAELPRGARDVRAARKGRSAGPARKAVRRRRLGGAPATRRDAECDRLLLRLCPAGAPGRVVAWQGSAAGRRGLLPIATGGGWEGTGAWRALC